ncbi:MAG: hypothetical protein JSU73_05920 [candidate division WOR-3 bacterium]|nr:MAG: hypothetical protein JSU73_05920 [candidate division WOR-3 bacterium]
MPCPVCNSNDAVAVYFHECPGVPPPGRFMHWLEFPPPPTNPATGRPQPVPCPDGLAYGVPPACGQPVEAMALYCYHCQDPTTGQPGRLYVYGP